MSKCKTTPGYRVESLDHAVTCLRIGYYLYVGDRLYHPKWIVNWSLTMLAQRIHFSGVYIARYDDGTFRTADIASLPEI